MVCRAPSRTAMRRSPVTRARRPRKPTPQRDFPHTTKTATQQAGQSHPGRRAGRRQLYQERQGRDGLSERGKAQLGPDCCAALHARFDQKRGDQVEVVKLPVRFAEAPIVALLAEPAGLLGMLQFTKDDVSVRPSSQRPRCCLAGVRSW